MCCRAFGRLTPFSLPEAIYEGFCFSVNIRRWARGGCGHYKGVGCFFGKLVGIFISDVAAVIRDPKKVEDSRVGVQGSCNRVKDFWDFGFGSAGKKGSSRIRKNFDRHKLVEFAYCKV